MSDQKRARAIAKNLRKYRGEISLSELERKSGISKSYLWTLENAKTPTKPSAETLYKIAVALGVTVSDLFGRDLQVRRGNDVPPSLAEFARQRDLPESDVQMLAGINFRGEQPTTPERWALIYEAIRAGTREGE